MLNYEIRVIPKLDDSGKTYWTAFFPAIPGCVGGGDNAEEAMREANENLELFLEYLEEERKSVPLPYEEPQYAGKIALRIPKSTHKKIAELAESEGVSINAILNSAIECYLGMKQFDYQIEKKISDLQEVATKTLQVQIYSATRQEELLSAWKGITMNKSIQF